MDTVSGNVKRYESIDCLRGGAIILVVLGHLNPGIYLEKWIYSFHMFLFFFLSGYLFQKKETWVKQWKATGKACLLPYFFWNLCAVLVSLAIGEYDLRAALCKLLYLGGSVSWNSPVWFLVVLFWLKLVGQAVAGRTVIELVMIPMGLLLGYLNILGKFPFGISILPTAVVFFLLGALLRGREEVQVHNWGARWRDVCVTCALLSGSLLFGLRNSRISVYGVYYGRYFLAIAAGISGVLGLWLLVKLMYAAGVRIHFLEYWGKYTLNVMCTHYFLLRGMSAFTVQVWNGYDVWNRDGFGKATVCTVLVFLVAYWVIEGLKHRKTPSSDIFVL